MFLIWMLHNTNVPKSSVTGTFSPRVNNKLLLQLLHHTETKILANQILSYWSMVGTIGLLVPLCHLLFFTGQVYKKKEKRRSIKKKKHTTYTILNTFWNVLTFWHSYWHLQQSHNSLYYVVCLPQSSNKNKENNKVQQLQLIRIHLSHQPGFSLL